MNIGKRITFFRTAKNYSVNKLATLSGISQSYLRDIELGNKNPTIEILSYICEALNISLREFFDEQTNGLDPQAVIDLRKKLLDIRNDGTSILLSSHQLSEVDKLVDRIIFIKDGQLIAHKTIDELHQKHISCIKTSDNQYAQKILKNYIVTNDNEYIRLECGSDNDFSNVINLLVKNNISIYSIEDKGEDLEKYYQNLYQG